MKRANKATKLNED